MRMILPVFFIIAAIGLFFGFIDPAFDRISILRDEDKQFNEALDKSKELQAIRDGLLSRFNTFSTEDLRRLSKLLPDNVDNVRLVLDLDGIASNYQMRIRDVIVSRREIDSPEFSVIGPDTSPFGSVVLSFSVASTYENFVQFIKDLEDSLRIVDVAAISFTEPKGDLYEFSVSIKTYWLK